MNPFNQRVLDGQVLKILMDNDSKPTHKGIFCMVTKKKMPIILESINRLIANGYHITYWNHKYLLHKSKSEALAKNPMEEDQARSRQTV